MLHLRCTYVVGTREKQTKFLIRYLSVEKDATLEASEVNDDKKRRSDSQHS